MERAGDSTLRLACSQARLTLESSLRSWRDFVRECFCFGSEAVNASSDAVRGLVKSRVEFAS